MIHRSGVLRLKIELKEMIIPVESISSIVQLDLKLGC